MMRRSSNITLVTRTLADDALSFHGQWSFNSDLLSGQNASFHTSNNLGDRASLSFNGEMSAALAPPHADTPN